MISVEVETEEPVGGENDSAPCKEGIESDAKEANQEKSESGAEEKLAEEEDNLKVIDNGNAEVKDEKTTFDTESDLEKQTVDLTDAT